MRVPRLIRRVGALALASGVAMGTMALTTGTAAADPPWTKYKGKIIANGGLTIRSAPSTHTSNKGIVAKGTTITIDCKVPATSVAGNRLWYRLTNGKGWVAARYVTNIGSAPRYCPIDDTAGGGTGHTTAAVNRRQGPHLKDVRLGTLPKGTRVHVICYVTSTAGVGGNYDWYQLTDRSWVTDAYLKRVVDRPPNWGSCTV